MGSLNPNADQLLMFHWQTSLRLLLVEADATVHELVSWFSVTCFPHHVMLVTAPVSCCNSSAGRVLVFPLFLWHFFSPVFFFQSFHFSVTISGLSWSLLPDCVSAAEEHVYDLMENFRVTSCGCSACYNFSPHSFPHTTFHWPTQSYDRTLTISNVQ